MNSHPHRHSQMSPLHSRPRARSGLLVLALALALPQVACVIHNPPPVYVEAPPPPPPVVVEENVVVADDFYEPLGNYGVWVYAPGYGRVWQPAPDMVGERFVPYASHGRWVVNDDGDWVFVSRYDTQWGWATYHYGRWAWTDYYGWVWVPGTAWAPSWVEWRYGGGYVGWVPMGPPGYVVVEEHWVFVEEGHIGAEGVIEHRLPPERARGAYVAASPIIEVKGSSKWMAGPDHHKFLTAGIEVTSAHVQPPPAGYVKTQGRMAIDAAADRRAAGQIPVAPQVRAGATVPPGVTVIPPGPSQAARPSGIQNDPNAQMQRRPDGSNPGQASMPMPAPGPNAPNGTQRQMPQPSPTPVNEPRQTMQPSMPQPAPRPAAAPTPRPAPQPTAAPRPAPRPSAPAPRPSGGKKRR